MALTVLEAAPVKNREVANVLRHNRPPFGDGCCEDIRIRDLPQLGAFSYRKDIESFLPQGLTDGRILLLIEQQPQRRAACCWRFAAAAP